MSYSPTTWTQGVTPGNATNMNHLETQYTEAVNSFGPNLFTAYVLTGYVATKDGTTASQLDVTAGTAYPQQSDNSLRARASGPLTYSTTGHVSTTMYLDLNPDGTWSWGTAHSGVSNHLTICTVTTDASANIATVTDTRPLNPTLLSGMAGTLLLTNDLSSTRRYLSTVAGSTGSPFMWNGVAGTSFFGVLDINPSDGGQTHWIVGYNGGDGHFQIQQVTGNIDVVDIDSAGNVYTASDLHVTNNLYTGGHLIPGIPGLGNNWITVMDMISSGTPTVNNEWRLNYDGSTGNLNFYDVTHGRLTFYMSASNGLAAGLNGLLLQARSAGGGASGQSVWVGTTDPGSNAAEGDIWAKA